MPHLIGYSKLDQQGAAALPSRESPGPLGAAREETDAPENSALPVVGDCISIIFL